MESVGDSAAETPLTVLFVVTSMHGGGAEWVGRLWMEWLVARGHAVSVVTTSDKDTDRFIPDGVRSATLGGLSGHGAKLARLRRLIIQAKPDVVVGLQMYPNLLATGAVKSIPARQRPAVVVSEHNIISFGLPGSPLSHRVKTWLARRTYGTADHLIAVSHAVAGEMIGGFGVLEGRCTVVPNPAASKVGTRVVPTRSADVDIDLVIAHRLVVQKRPQLAVRTAAELAQRGHRVRLTVFGQGPLLDDIIALSRELGVDLDHRGWAEEWFAECSDKSVFLLASNREGFGNVLVEAAAAGIPSVALSGALGVADAIVPGLTGALAASDDPTAIADAIELASHIRIAGIGRWLDRFTYRTSGSTLEHVLEGVARQRPRP